MFAPLASAPAPLSRHDASTGPIARSSAPNSAIPPWARRRAAGSGTPAREASAIRHPAGRCRTNSAIARRHCLLVTASAWSSTTVTGRRIEATADTNRGTAVMLAPEDASAQKMPGSTGSIRSSAIARALSSTTGSLSPSSQETQATRGPIRSAHCAMSVVLP